MCTEQISHLLNCVNCQSTKRFLARTNLQLELKEKRQSCGCYQIFFIVYQYLIFPSLTMAKKGCISFVCAITIVVITIILSHPDVSLGAPAPLLLGNQMAALAVIPKTEEQAAALLQFLNENPQLVETDDNKIEVDEQEVILVEKEDVSQVSNGLEEIGLRLGNSSVTYQVS